MEYDITQKDWVKKIQQEFPTNPILSRIPLSAREYYQIALTKGESINSIDKANSRGTVKE